jgi:hypothetical protein
MSQCTPCATIIKKDKTKIYYQKSVTYKSLTYVYMFFHWGETSKVLDSCWKIGNRIDAF